MNVQEILERLRNIRKNSVTIEEDVEELILDIEANNGNLKIGDYDVCAEEILWVKKDASHRLCTKYKTQCPVWARSGGMWKRFRCRGTLRDELCPSPGIGLIRNMTLVEMRTSECFECGAMEVEPVFNPKGV